MNFEEQISINNITYELVDIQRSGVSAIYKNADNYLRIGIAEKIEKDLSFHKEMERLGFPVAKLISEGQHNDLLYFIEESLGEECFGQIFKRDTEALGHVSEESFDVFLNVLEKFANAQLKTATKNKDWDAFGIGIHLDIICNELPEYEDRIKEHFDITKEKLKDLPFGILHGDFTPFNIYPKGVIDLEDSFMGPVGYDIGAFPELSNWFPDKSDDQLHKVYKFTDEQKNIMITKLDELYQAQNLPKLSQYLDDFNFLKGIWFVVRMHNYPNLQKFRYDLIKSLV